MNESSTPTLGTATYDLSDNKLRFYPDARLDDEDYQRFSTLGFHWAPTQELFVAPKWTPQREDLLVEFCGAITEEDTTLAERSEDRAQRFNSYGASATDNEAYWQSRAKSVVAAADYKARPAVRARRVKKLEAEQRASQRSLEELHQLIELWSDPDLTPDQALAITNNRDHLSHCFPVADYPRSDGASSYEGPMSLWSALNERVINHRQARTIALESHQRSIEGSSRWIAHRQYRLAYERALLKASGWEPPKPKARPKQKPLLNYRADEIYIENIYTEGQIHCYPQTAMTRKEWARIYRDYKSTRLVDGTHRVRTAMIDYALTSVFLTDAKEHPRPPSPNQATEVPHQEPEASPPPAEPPTQAPTEPEPALADIEPKTDTLPSPKQVSDHAPRKAAPLQLSLL